MDLAALQIFLTVAEERSFSRAAAKVHRTQPAVSQAVRGLEETVGERLFDRATKDATLTEAGRLLRDYADAADAQDFHDRYLTTRRALHQRAAS